MLVLLPAYALADGGGTGVSGIGVSGTGVWQGTEQVQLRLISSTTHYDGNGAIGGHIRAGLEVKLADGWKIYWRSPGDAGLPPMLEFAGGASHEMRFPAPTRFTLFGFETFGYSDAVIFPLRIDTPAGAGDLELAAAFSGLVCADVCIPVDEMLTLRLDRGDAAPSPHAFGIAKAEALVPSVGTSNGYRITRTELRGGQLEVAIAAHDDTPFIMRQGDVLVESAVQGVGFARPHFLGDVGRITITGENLAELVGTSAIITILHPQFMLEEKVVITQSEFAPNSTMPVALVSILLAAFLGGLILNVMPCVLPVLSLKLTAILRQDQADLARVRRSFLLSATGIVLSFLSLGVGLLLLRQGGVAIGWGIQFQNAYFLGFMVLVMLAFALMMLDVVRVPIPALAGWKFKGAHTAWHDLASGFMATLLATPCSAPFVGTAIAFAFTAPSALMLAVFLAMALGLASPWLLVAAFPQSARALPRGGAWVIWLRRGLALGLVATAVWLVLVLGAVIGGGQGASDVRGAWQKWQPQLAARLADEGKIVLVDVTADWCLTCKANQLFVFESAAIKQLFAEEKVVLLRADWTRPDATILQYLTQFDRYGIPFTAVYNGGGAPLILPELLTEDTLTEAITTTITTKGRKP